ncbi:MAG TPA: pseudouridine synthase [Thermoanaerobaculia bacterium]
MSEERVQRILARAGIASRRKAEELIREGRVTINGRVAEIGDKADPENDAIKLDGKRVQPHGSEYRYLLLNKPKGVMSTISDPQGRKTVLDFVPPAMRKAVVPVGRLDYNSEGLLILTDDGGFAQHVAHPRYGGVKTYEVKVKGEPNEAQIDRLRAGVKLEGRRTLPCRITKRPSRGREDRRRSYGADDDDGHNTWWVVELTEGRSRQIREMFFHIGHPVQKLRRVAIGPLRDPDLPIGALRELSDREVAALRKVTAKLKKPAPPKERKERTAEKPARKRVPASKPAKKAAAKKAPKKSPHSPTPSPTRTPNRPGEGAPPPKGRKAGLGKRSPLSRGKGSAGGRGGQGVRARRGRRP